MPDLLDRLRTALADRYRVEREIGRGGMAQVFLAHDLKLDRPVALKVLRPELAAALGGNRFLREITVSAQLDHPHILPLLDSGDVDGTLFYTMPFVEGESLRDRLDRESQLPLEEALQLTREIADALSHAHSRGIIHRDIKPENILLAGGHARVADFGIAKAVTDAGGENLTGTGVSIGTPAYMSPEQAEATKPVGARSDLYSLGCVLYEMLAGHPPFQGSTAHELLVRHASDPIPPLRSGRSTVPEPIEVAVERALAKVPADRFATAAQFGAALELDPVVYRRQQRRRKTMRRVAATVGAALVTAVGVWAATRRPAVPEADPTIIPIDSTAVAVLPFHVVGADSASPARTLARFIGDLFELKVTGEFHYRIRHPGSVAERWREAGGTLDSALSEEAELAVARAVGAGRLIRGTVVALGDSLVISGSMLDASRGRVLVKPVRVEGTLERQQELVDYLIVELLAREYFEEILPGGEGTRLARSSGLAQYKPEAIQAYLAGSRAPPLSEEAKRLYRAALAADSTFISAALDTYAEGERVADTAELRYAWEHRDGLTERRRAYVEVLAAGRYSDVWTGADVIERYEALARQFPEWRPMRVELAQKLAHWGALASVPDWRGRAWATLKGIRLDTYAIHSPTPMFARWEMAELAFMEKDTVRARMAVAGLDSANIRNRLLTYRWRLATLLGDEDGARKALDSLPDQAWVVPFALADGLGIADADRSEVYPFFRDKWGWARGNARELRDGWLEAQNLLRNGSPPSDDLVPVFRALFLGMPEDSAVLGAASRLERLAGGSGLVPGGDVQTMAIVWTALWRIAHGDTQSTAEAIRYLETVDRPRTFAGWARMLEALRAEATGGDVNAALVAWESVVRELPVPNDDWYPRPAEVQNLVLARMFARHGEYHRALAAVRRRPYYALGVVMYTSLPEYLREEARLAALVGDTAGAMKAYSHYLALREDPDPPWRPQWDSVRVELDRLLRARG